MDGQKVVLPFTREIVPEIDLGGRRLVVELPAEPDAGEESGHDGPWSATVLSLFPEMFPGPLGLLAGRQGAGRRPLVARDAQSSRLRDRSPSTVDDTPFGGGAGMVMRPDVVATAVDRVGAAGEPRPLLYLSPRGRRLAQTRVPELAAGPGIVLPLRALRGR